MRLVWLICGLVALGLGLIGVILPGLPTVPFLLLATYCFSKSSRRMHDWLLGHPRLGPPIHDWNERGAIRRPIKWAATASILATFGISYLLNVGPMIMVVQAITLSVVALFIWSRPEH